ncbi:sentrin-specific protease 1 isoform X2 [Tachysurus fulvidraco]|uniref:sentrin-specific protease 1 isoform X2 n=1 Tax=Tachysurus fulvidraco TaxID=1234273 RepID=UPI001FEE5764|nr:sentrin-specific protease 1 isoform X2 [Tachysurus fulvidraco]
MSFNMFNKFYEWIESGLATLRNGAPAAGDPTASVRVQQDAPSQRKRPLESLEDGDAIYHEEGRAVKKFRMGDIMDTMKNAAEGVKTHGSSVASWMCNSVSPTLRNMLPASPGPPQTQILSSNATNSLGTMWTENKFVERPHETSKNTFVVPEAASEWKTIKSDSLRTESSVTFSKVSKQHVPASFPSHETHKTNGHPVTICTSKPCPSLRLGRPLYVRAQRSPSRLSTPGPSTGNISYTSMYEKTFPIRVVQNPSPGSTSRHWRGRTRCTAQESVREEEKEVYRQLLAMVSGSQSSFFHDCTSNPTIRSHRDFFLTSSRRLQCASPAGSGAGESSLGLSSLSPSPQSVSAVHSPSALSNGPEILPWDPDSDGKYIARKTVLAEQSVPSPAALQDTTSQDTQSSGVHSAHDGDSVIFVEEQHGKRPEGSSMPCFQAELWIKELTSLYDARARERRRLIEVQEALTFQLLHKRISGEGRPDLRSVELRVRVPLEKEVPVATVEVPEPEAEEQEFPELTEAMENAVSLALRGGSQDDVLSEGFRLIITRKDLQTLSSLNWLNDEVINFYMNMLVERSKSPHLPSVYTFNTFFFPKLRSSGYSAVRRWTKKVDIFSVDIILVPVHLGVHWCLSVVDFRKKTITYFDSMGGSNDEACRILLNYLKRESEDKKKQAFNTSDWILHSKRRNEIPQQMNGSDCGMFTCKYAEYITKDKPITFTQKHMPYFRRRMVWEILNRKLLR